METVLLYIIFYFISYHSIWFRLFPAFDLLSLVFLLTTNKFKILKNIGLTSFQCFCEACDLRFEIRVLSFESRDSRFEFRVSRFEIRSQQHKICFVILFLLVSFRFHSDSFRFVSFRLISFTSFTLSYILHIRSLSIKLLFALWKILLPWKKNLQSRVGKMPEQHSWNQFQFWLIRSEISR